MATPDLTGFEAPQAEPPISVPLPPPSTFDILPPLHQLLSRLLAQSSSVTGPDGISAGTTSTGLSSDPNTLTYTDLQPLEIQHLAAEAGTIKSKIQRARAEVKKLPDMDRTVEEQEEEIEDLELKCRLLREALLALSQRASEESGAFDKQVKTETSVPNS